MVILMFVIAAAVSAPIVAAVLVSAGSRREDSAWSLGGPPRGTIQGAARRIVRFHDGGIDWPQPRSRVQAPVRERGPAPEQAWPRAQAEPSSPVPAQR